MPVLHQFIWQYDRLLPIASQHFDDHYFDNEYAGFAPCVCNKRRSPKMTIKTPFYQLQAFLICQLVSIQIILITNQIPEGQKL